MAAMRRFVQRTDDRFRQLLRIAREQEADLEEVRQAMKRPKHDEH